MGKAHNWCEKQANNVGRLEERSGDEGNKWRESAVTQSSNSVVNERLFKHVFDFSATLKSQKNMFSIHVHSNLHFKEHSNKIVFKAVVSYQKSNKRVS